MFSSEPRLIAWLTLYFCPGIGAKILSQLLLKDSAENIVQYSLEQLRSLGLSTKQIAYIHSPEKKKIDDCLMWKERDELNSIILLGDVCYPTLLSEISSAPPLLFIQGDVQLLSAPQIAIVGSRNASLEALESSKQFAHGIAKQGYVVTSGLAFGVDGYSHHGAIEAKGKTIAVLGSGLNNIYPKQHCSLAQRILEYDGALVSEFHPDCAPRANNFPRRNRIISGLSTGVLVIEAAERSGSLITARYANEQGREVFALPASIYNTRAQGSNSLIKSGAKLVSFLDDIFEEVEPLTQCAIYYQQRLFEENILKSNKGVCAEQLPFPKVFATVGEKVTPVDIIAEQCQTPVHEIMSQLLELELQGFITAVPGGYIKKRRS